MSRIKEFTVGKEMKVGLPNYSNVTASAYIVFEVNEDETPNWDEAWNIINQQLSAQVNDVDPDWIKTEEFGKFFRITTKVQK